MPQSSGITPHQKLLLSSIQFFCQLKTHLFEHSYLPKSQIFLTDLMDIWSGLLSPPPLFSRYAHSHIILTPFFFSGKVSRNKPSYMWAGFMKHYKSSSFSLHLSSHSISFLFRFLTFHFLSRKILLLLLLFTNSRTLMGTRGYSQIVNHY